MIRPGLGEGVERAQVAVVVIPAMFTFAIGFLMGREHVLRCFCEQCQEEYRQKQEEKKLGS
jgi:hypothetical protein